MLKKLKKILLHNLLYSISITIFLLFNFNFLIFGYPVVEGATKNFQYPVIYYLKESVSQGVFPFYTERLFSGYPIYQNPETAYLNPLRLLLTALLPFEKVISVEYLFFFILGLIGYFKLLRSKKISDSAIFFSHFVFFYSLPLVQKLTDITFTYSIFLIPLTFYFLEKIILSLNKFRYKKYIIYLVITLTTSFLYGNYESSLILLASQLVYVVLLAFKTRQFIYTLKFLSIYLFLSFSMSLYALFPSWDLFTNSMDTSFRHLISFSTSPSLTSINLLTPFILGDSNNFSGLVIDSNWKWGDVHSYLGLSVLVLALGCFIYLKNLQFKDLFIVSFALFVSLVYFNTGLFIYLFSFSLSLLFSSVLDHLFNIYVKEEPLDIFKNISYLIIPTSILLLSILTTLGSNQNQILFKYLLEKLPFGIPYFMPSLISTLFLFGLILMYKFTHRKAFIYVLPIICVVEILIFSFVLSINQTKNINLINPEIKQITDYYSDQRVVFDTKIEGNESLYYKNWNVYGFSSYVPRNYASYMNLVGLNTQKFTQKNYYLLDNVGVFRVIDVNNNILASGETGLLSLPYKLVVKDENNKKFQIYTDSNKTIDTKIKFDQNIEVYLNNQKVENPSVKGIFYSFDLADGENTIQFYYNPKILYFGIVMSLISSIIGILMLKELNA